MIMIKPSGQLHEECFEDKKRPDIDQYVAKNYGGCSEATRKRMKESILGGWQRQDEDDRRYNAETAESLRAKIQAEIERVSTQIEAATSFLNANPPKDDLDLRTKLADPSWTAQSDVDTLRKTLGILTGDFYGVEEQIKQGKTREAAIRWDIYLHGYLNENGATGKTY